MKRSREWDMDGLQWGLRVLLGIIWSTDPVIMHTLQCILLSVASTCTCNTRCYILNKIYPRFVSIILLGCCVLKVMIIRQYGYEPKRTRNPAYQ